MGVRSGVVRDKKGLPIVGVAVNVVAVDIAQVEPNVVTTSNPANGSWSLSLESGVKYLVVYYLDGTYKGDFNPSGAKLVEEPA